MQLDNNRLRQGRSEQHVKRNEKCAAYAIVIGGSLILLTIIMSQCL